MLGEKQDCAVTSGTGRLTFLYKLSAFSAVLSFASATMQPAVDPLYR